MTKKLVKKATPKKKATPSRSFVLLSKRVAALETAAHDAAFQMNRITALEMDLEHFRRAAALETDLIVLRARVEMLPTAQRIDNLERRVFELPPGITLVPPGAAAVVESDDAAVTEGSS